VPLATSKEWVCIDREPTWGTEVSHNVLCKLLDICFSTRTKEGDTPVRQYALLDLDRASVDLAENTAHDLRLHQRHRRTLHAEGKLLEPQEIRAYDRKDYSSYTHPLTGSHHNFNTYP